MGLMSLTMALDREIRNSVLAMLSLRCLLDNEVGSVKQVVGYIFLELKGEVSTRVINWWDTGLEGPDRYYLK